MEGGGEPFLMNKDREEALGGGEGGSQKRKQNQTAIFTQSSLTFNCVTHRDLAHYE